VPVVHTARGIGARDSGSVSKAVVAATAVGVVYGIFGFVTALVISKPGMELSPLRAAAHLLVIGTLAALIGSLRTTDGVRTIARVTPVPIRDGVRTGVVGALMVLGAGAGLTGLAVALNGVEAVQLFRAFPSGRGRTGRRHARLPRVRAKPRHMGGGLPSGPRVRHRLGTIVRAGRRGRRRNATTAGARRCPQRIAGGARLASDGVAGVVGARVGAASRTAKAPAAAHSIG
jgi:heme A synthase